MGWCLELFFIDHLNRWICLSPIVSLCFAWTNMTHHDTNFQILWIVEIYNDKVVIIVLVVSACIYLFFCRSTVPPFHGSLNVVDWGSRFIARRLWDGWTSCFWLADEALGAAAWGQHGSVGWLVVKQDDREHVVAGEIGNTWKKQSIWCRGWSFWASLGDLIISHENLKLDFG